MVFGKDGLKRPVVVFPVRGGACTVPAVLDFTRSRPSRAKDVGAPLPANVGASLRFRLRVSGRGYVPVDPALLAMHLEFGEGGRVVKVSAALVAFWGRVAAACTGRGGRLLVGGDPAVTTRAVSRGTELNFEPRTLFCAKRCHCRGCTRPVVAGVFCASHYDSTFFGGLGRHKVSQTAAARAHRQVEAEANLVFGDYDGFWISIAEWLYSAPIDPSRMRAYVVNHLADVLPILAMTTVSADRLAALVHCSHPSVQSTQAFYNAQLAISYIRTIRGSLPVLASNVAASLSKMYLYGIPRTKAGAGPLCDRGIIPCVKMPVLQTVDGSVGSRAAMYCSTVIPDHGEALVNVVFNVVALRVLSRVFGVLGTFSFTVLTGTLAIPEGAIVLDASAPLDLGPYMRYTGIERADRVLHVLSPAALSPTVLHAIIFSLGFKHVYFCGPRFGSTGIRLPTFKEGTGDPTVGFLWRCILHEAESRGQIRSAGTGDPLWRHEGRGFLKTFVTENVPGRCKSGCSSCTPTSSWHVDQLMAEAAYGTDAPGLLPPCARTGTELLDSAEADEGIRYWQTLCDLTTEAILGSDP